MPSEAKKHEFIDALRGYAIALVVLVHSSQVVRPVSDALQNLMDFGARGVQLFFIASALTLSMSWFARSKEESSRVQNFFIRRFFRIAPMYWLAIVFYLTIYGFEERYWAPNGLNWYSIPMTALFVNGYSPQNINALVPGGWSIAVEMNFYLVFPILVGLACNLRKSIVLIVFSIGLSGAAYLVFRAAFMDTVSSNQRYMIHSFLYENFFNQLPVFTIGIACYFIIFDPVHSRRAAEISLVALTTIAILFCFFGTRLVQYISEHLLLTALLFAMITVALSQFPKRPLVNSTIRHLGKVSFSLYLVHFGILHYFQRFGIKSRFEDGNSSSMAYFFLVLSAGALLASLLHAVIEKPSINLATRIIRRLENRRQSV